MSGRIRRYEEQFMLHLQAGEFSVDQEGRIWKHIDLRNRNCKIDPPRRAERGRTGNYQQVSFVHEGKRLNATAHRVVYRALKGEIPPGLTVNHENGIKDHNHPDNLILATDSEQILHAVRVLKVGRVAHQWGEANHAAKLSDQEVQEIRSLYTDGQWTMEQIGIKYGVRFQQISRIIRGKRRVQQAGPVADCDLRHFGSVRDLKTGRATSVPLISRSDV